jgi:hypothetical protein
VESAGVGVECAGLCVRSECAARASRSGAVRASTHACGCAASPPVMLARMRTANCLIVDSLSNAANAPEEPAGCFSRKARASSSAAAWSASPRPRMCWAASACSRPLVAPASTERTAHTRAADEENVRHLGASAHAASRTKKPGRSAQLRAGTDGHGPIRGARARRTYRRGSSRRAGPAAAPRTLGPACSTAHPRRKRLRHVSLTCDGTEVRNLSQERPCRAPAKQTGDERRNEYPLPQRRRSTQSAPSPQAAFRCSDAVGFFCSLGRAHPK